MFIGKLNKYVMKKGLLLLVICILGVHVYAGDIDESRVPRMVKESVKKAYPEAARVKWDFEEDENVYEAEFEIGDLEYKLEITPEGKIVYSKEDITIESIPPVIKEYLAKEYAGYKIMGANKIMKKGVVKYDVGIVGKNSYGHKRHYNIHFDAEGKVMRDKN